MQDAKAEAGIQPACLPRARNIPDLVQTATGFFMNGIFHRWIPACAGMTQEKMDRFRLFA